MSASTTRSIRSARTATGAFCTSSSAKSVSSISTRPSSSSRRSRLHSMAQTQLAAGGVDVGPLSLANGRRHSPLFQRLDKPSQSFDLRVVKGEFRDGVHGNQIDVRMAAAHEPDQLAGL